MPPSDRPRRRKATTNERRHLRGFLAIPALAALIVVYFSFDRPSGQSELLYGTVEAVRLEISKGAGTHFKCRIVIDNGVIFEQTCNLKPGERVSVRRTRRSISGAYIYRLL